MRSKKMKLRELISRLEDLETTHGSDAKVVVWTDNASIEYSKIRVEGGIHCNPGKDDKKFICILI